MMISPMKRVWSQKDMTTIQKIVLLSIADRANVNNICWPSIKRIMQDTSIGNERTVRNALKALQERGIIAVNKTHGKVNHYTVNLDALAPHHGQKCPTAKVLPQAEVPPPPRAEVPPHHGQKCPTKSIKKSTIEEKTSLFVNTDESDVDETDDDILRNPTNAPAKPDTCPYGKIVELYHKIFPGHPIVKKLTSARKKNIKARWTNDVVDRLKDLGKPTGQVERLEYIEAFFNVAQKSDFLTGRKPGRSGPFFANIDFLMNEEKFTRVLEDYYKNREV